jgi:riboflavin-specific deaminase-like protein
VRRSEVRDPLEPAVRRFVPDDAEEPVEEVYAELVLPTVRGRAAIALGMVSSVDGAAAVDGATAELGGVADHHAFRALRGACDAVLVGAGTVRAERYGPVRGTAVRRGRREEKGLAARPQLVIVSGSLALDPEAEVFADPSVRPLIVTHGAAPAERVRALSAVADVVRTGDDEVDLDELAVTLHERGLTRVLCEGGPSLNGALLHRDLVDEVFLTLAPVLVGGGAPRIVVGDHVHEPRPFRLVELREHQGELLLRYRRARDGAAG